MGVYLNSKNPFGLFLDEFASTYFVDKSEMLNELIPLVSPHEDMVWQEEANKGKSNKYVCITRPRRFGKTLMASMIASFFGKGRDSRKVFQQLKIGTSENFEAFYYVRENTDTVRDELALMVSGVPVPAKVREYAATSMELKTKDEIFSVMVVYGFLNYEDGCVSIPNRELMEKFADILSGKAG